MARKSLRGCLGWFFLPTGDHVQTKEQPETRGPPIVVDQFYPSTSVENPPDSIRITYIDNLAEPLPLVLVFSNEIRRPRLFQKLRERFAWPYVFSTTDKRRKSQNENDHTKSEHLEKIFEI